ncbi:ATP-binding protein [Roseomonas genomospecies 6]|uniref:histidine kinase n=1 Tax=Roseomonas genomospecies 6 TaxID=214106 RepID=A0A9W7NL43_9PROT|nr:ATP-binding protein [Roseomonas genomospecies 6]KAA0681897.1 PAS domain-containing protein [Roseomonas genomospecies 6]
MATAGTVLHALSTRLFGRATKGTRIAVAACVYVGLWIILYEVAHLFDIAHSASAWYPGPGLTIAFCAVYGPRYFPAVILGAFLYENTFTHLDIASGLRHVIVYGSAGFLLRRLIAPAFPLRTKDHVSVFLLVACVSTLASAALAGATFQPYWTNSTFTDILVSFWIGDLAGVLLAGPVFLITFSWLGTTGWTAPMRWVPRVSASTGIGAVCIVVFAIVAFEIDATLGTNGKAWFVVLFPVVLLALRQGFGGAVAGIIVVNITAVLLFKVLGRVGDPAQLQVLLIMIDIAALLIGATISEQKATEQGLRASERRQRDVAAAVHASPVGTTIVNAADPNLPFVFANDAFHHLSGYSPEHLLTVGLADLLASDSRHCLEEIHRAIGQKESTNCEVTLRTANGEWVRDRLTVAPISDSEGGPGSYLVLHEDVAVTRNRERQEREREKLVALGQLAGGVAHEINNLLHPMINLAMEAEHLWGQEGRDARRHLRMIRSSGSKAADIVRKVLGFARQGTGPRVPLDFGDAVLSAVDLNRRSLPPSVTIHTRIDATGMIWASATEVSQVLTNLLLNASQAMDGLGTVDVVLDRNDGEAADSSFRLTVVDDGPGMDEAVRARVFEPFFTTKPLGSGTGLGLSVVYGIVKDWGGGIDVRTAPDKGTTFIITVPAADTNT